MKRRQRGTPNREAAAGDAFCPVDGALVAVDIARCPVCGLDLRQLSRDPYEMKLLRALAHPLGEVRGRAARLLGKCGSPSAFAPLRALASQGRRDPFVAAEALRGLARLCQRHPAVASPDWEKFGGSDQPVQVRSAAAEVAATETAPRVRRDGGTMS